MIYYISHSQQELGYNGETDKFAIPPLKIAYESLFMTMDELCFPMDPQHIRIQPSENTEVKADAMEKLVRELIGDKLLELRRYVILDTIKIC